ncbi:MAG: 1-acyl-sn-glycerol-3-phosphate acyltransferase [Deltaproteobacteria bacterium]|nr:1-acyl-sn-glycerol-3-phosphate acyltransferase [Deltaproteobacteria bacterium]
MNFSHSFLNVQKVETLKWRLINCSQVIIGFAWTMLTITLALAVLGLTLNRKIALLMANKIWAPGVLFITGTRLQVEGLENINFKTPHIFVMHHQSTLDIPAAFTALPVPLHFIAKKELRAVPFLGWYIWAMGMIFIDRKNHDKAVASLNHAADMIRNGKNVIAYPEGTRSDKGDVRPFKKGVFVLAIQSQTPVVPIAISGSKNVMPKNSFRMRPGLVKIKIGTPIVTKNMQSTDRDDLMSKAHAQMVELMREISA